MWSSSICRSNSNDLIDELTKGILDVRETSYNSYNIKGGVRIVIPVLGCTKDDVEINYRNNVISVTYDKTKDLRYQTKQKTETLDIRVSGKFDPETSKAKVENGLLVIDVLDSAKGNIGLIPIT